MINFIKNLFKEKRLYANCIKCDAIFTPVDIDIFVPTMGYLRVCICPKCDERYWPKRTGYFCPSGELKYVE